MIAQLLLFSTPYSWAPFIVPWEKDTDDKCEDWLLSAAWFIDIKLCIWPHLVIRALLLGVVGPYSSKNCSDARYALL